MSARSKSSLAFVLPLVLAILLLWARSTDAARPLLDQHQWDRYFALSARDVAVPWKPAEIRLATYSGAPVDLAVYAIDPAEVIVAGQNRPSRAIDTSRRKPLARWRFTPPAAYRFEVSDVSVPIGNQEGFYVVEARRGDASQQVWLNRTHIGLVTKESPGGLLLWCVDLRSGHPLQHTDVSFLVKQELITRTTDARGLIAWEGSTRPTFALAERGAARAFLSLLPQAPLPAKIVGIRLEKAGAHAGESVRFIGFARQRTPQGYRRIEGDARVTLLDRGKPLTASTAHLDASGAFTGSLNIPDGTESGEYAVLATVAGGVGGTSLRVDAGKSVSLSIASNCPCASSVALTIAARSEHEPAAHLPIRVRVIRSPHVIPPKASDNARRWGTTVVYEATATTDENGEARVDLPAPTDGLPSTYGVRATAGGASATSLVVVPTSSVALALEPDHEKIDVGEPAGFNVRGFDSTDGRPLPNLPVSVRLVHGPVAWEQHVQLDAHGAAHVTFSTPSLGTDLAFASAHDAQNRQALDVTDVNVDPSNRHAGDSGSGISVALDRDRYRPGGELTVTANLEGASGEALVTVEGFRTYESRLASISRGRAIARLKLPSALGDVRIGVAAVRDGAIVLGSAPLSVDAPGHVREMDLALDQTSFPPDQEARISMHGLSASPKEATIVVRIADGRESEPADLDDAPDLLRIGGTTTQNPASADPAWHTFVAPAHSNAADIYAAERPRAQAVEDLTLGAAEPRTVLWRVLRSDAATLALPLPSQRGHYVISLLRISSDGSVGASSTTVNVQ